MEFLTFLLTLVNTGFLGFGAYLMYKDWVNYR